MSGNNFSAVVSRGKSTTLIVNRQIWKKSSTRYTGIGKDTDSVSCKILVRRLIFNSPLSMSFPGLYNQVTPVSTERITLPTAAVLTRILHLLMNLLMYVRTYCTYYCTYCTRTYYTYCCPVRTTYWHTYELHCWCTYVCILKNGSAAE